MHSFMRRLHNVPPNLVIAALLLLVFAWAAESQGPLTPIGNLRGRTDANGALIVAPLTGESFAVTLAGENTASVNVLNVPDVRVENNGPTSSSEYATDACYKTSTASTNATSCADAAANYYGIEYAINTTTTAAYLHLYNTAGSPTCNASIIATIPIPAASAAGVFGGVSLIPITPTNYATGIGICITGAADGTTNAPAGVYVKLNYKE